MKIYAIVVTYNGKRWYDRCLGSLRDSEMSVETIVVDNASSVDSIEYIKEHFPDVHLVECKENYGFAKANNIGIRYAIDHEADFVFLLNQDAWVEKDTLTKLVQAFQENKNVGIASPIHLNGSYSGLDARFCESMPWKFTSDMFRGRMDKYYIARGINAAAWLIGADCIKTVGGFDTSLFVHCGEDDNYCQRIQYHGFKLIVNTSCTICHDREFRDPNNDANRTQWRDMIRKEEIAERWSNINNTYNMDEIIKKYKKKRIVSKVMLKPDKTKQYDELIEICQKVKESREINKSKGLNWL